MSTRLRNSLSPASNLAGEGAHRIAAIQMASGPSIAANLTEADMLISLAASQGAKLIALPEYFAIMGMRDTDKVAARERLGEGPIQEFLSRTARKHGIWLIGGSIPLVSETADKVKNSTLVFNDQGVQVARYDKMHLFGFQMGDERYQEENTISPGNEVVVFDSPFGRVGLSICYDLRFPELYRKMQNVDLIVVPSAFTETTGKAHWEPLLRARAIENLAYVLAPGQGGYHRNGRETHGDSMVIDPWGVILDRLPRGSGFVLADLQPEYQARLRQSLPALGHRVLV